MIKTVMFDLDGTLLPFVQEDFIDLYFTELCKKLAPLGYEPENTIRSVWAGTAAMVKNTGEKLNSEVFWEVFNSMNKGLPDARPLCDEFYTKEFDNARACLKYKPDWKPMIQRLKAEGFRVVLATNPLFPLDGVKTRMAWANLAEEDFELITHYDNCSCCKPNVWYFADIADRLGARPEDCVMIGNSVSEDMCAEQLGMSVFLVTEFLENPEGKDISRFPKGSLDDAEMFVLHSAGALT